MKIVKRDITFSELANQSFWQRLFFYMCNQPVVDVIKYKPRLSIAHILLLICLFINLILLPIFIALSIVDSHYLSKTDEFDDQISFENVYILELGK